MAARPCPLFIDGPNGNLFLVHYEARGADTCVLLLPPFAEELNKSRRQLALVGAALAAHGAGFVVVDVRGTGDSDGEFIDASVEGWIDDLRTSVDWIGAQGYRRIVLLAIRSGALLAAPLCARLGAVRELLLWQPQLSGKTVVDQFLRLHVLADKMSDAPSGVTVKDLRARLQGGESIEVAGYDLGAGLVRGLDALDIGELSKSRDLRVEWFTLAREGVGPPRTEQMAIDKLATAGCRVSRRSFRGEPFWSTVEITEAPELVEMTTHLVGASA